MKKKNPRHHKKQKTKQIATLGDNRLQNINKGKKNTRTKREKRNIHTLIQRRLVKLKMTDLLAAAVKNHLGLHLLHWAVSHSDVWHLAHRCADIIHKIDEPLEKNAFAVDNLLTLDEDEIDCYGIRQLQMHNLHFDEEDEEDGYAQQQDQMNNNGERYAIHRNNHANELERAGK